MEQEPINVKTFDDPDFSIALKSDGIVYVLFKKGVEITVPLQDRLLTGYHYVTDSISHPFIFEGEDEVTINKDARDNAVDMEDRSPVGRSAVIVKSVAHSLIANFYLKFNKPKNPYRVFKSRKEALKWLKG